MSAYIVSENHIDALVHLALFGPINATNFHAPYFSDPSRKLEVDTVDILGREMVSENYASAAARYAYRDYAPAPPAYRFPKRLLATPPAMTTVEALKALQCYEYQSNEHEGWKDSATRRFCDQLKDALIRTLPGYDPAPWSL